MLVDYCTPCATRFRAARAAFVALAGVTRPKAFSGAVQEFRVLALAPSMSERVEVGGHVPALTTPAAPFTGQLAGSPLDVHSPALVPA